MLNAIFHGKAGRVEVKGQGESVSWRQLFQQREDLLTAAFFSRFAYLSPLMQHRLLKHWFGGEGDFTTFHEIEYWPQYELPHEDSRNFVEPDLLLRFAGFDVMVEVKPPQGGDQYFDQWRLEIEGYFASETNVKPLWFIAIGRVGGVSDEWQKHLMENEEVSLIKVAAIDWKFIATHIFSLINTGEPHCEDHRILQDMLKALSLYGVRGHDLHWHELVKLQVYTGELPDLFEIWSLNKQEIVGTIPVIEKLGFSNMLAGVSRLDLGTIAKWKI